MNEKLSLGVAREDITPEIGACLYGYMPDFKSESVNDRLKLTAFAFVQGKKKFLMISVDTCLINTKLYLQMRKEISEKNRIQEENIIVSATHTHTGPALSGHDGWGNIDMKYYESIFRPAILKASADALKNLRPVTVGINYGKSLLGINRREIDEKNIIHLGQDPDGVFNPEMVVISFKADSGEIVANIIHYGCHGTAAGMIPIISRDWSGVMTDELEKVSGGITAFFNGPEGDAGPRLSNGRTTGGDIKYVYEIGQLAAKDASDIFAGIKEYKNVVIDIKEGKIRLPYNSRISIAEAEKILEKNKGRADNIFGRKNSHAQMVKESYEKGYVEKKDNEILQMVVRIGEIVFATFPYELFAEIGMKIDKSVKDYKVLSLSSTNGNEGYFPTEKELPRGGYEVEHFKTSGVQSYADNADECLVSGTVANIKELVE